jgi:hypothetical protein
MTEPNALYDSAEAIQFDFMPLLNLTCSALLVELADAHTNLANLHERIGFLRAEEARKVSYAKEERMNLEGRRDAYIEKKFLIIRLLEYV